MVFTLGLRHTFALWQRALALVQFPVVQASLASFRAVSQKPSVVRPMANKDHYKPKNWREFTLMLTALLPIYVASHITSLIPPVAAFPNWLNELVDFACWVPLCILLVLAWARLLHLVRLLDDDQLSRYPFGLSSGRN